jgi:GR25 family glycosyltransferase involved in LPS biosynthesis
MKKPVLFLIFNRPEYTNQVFDSIRLYKPSKLYIAADGPRFNNENDLILCLETKSFIQLIDWECEVKTLFRIKNLGCKLAVSSAIDWFFENEQEGIILEDDVVPNEDFFRFTEFCLNKYKDDERIMMITGCNHFSEHNLKTSFFFSKIYSIWGWATWKRAWKHYDIEMKKWDDLQIKLDIKYSTNKKYIWKNYEFIFDSLKDYKIDTWDYQWHFTCLINNGLCVTPKVNLISNIGVIGTHSEYITNSHFLDKYFLEKPENYIIPETFLVNSKFDKKHYKLKNNRRYYILNFLMKIKLYNFFRFIKRKFVK